MEFIPGILILIFLTASNIRSECNFGRIETYWKQEDGTRCADTTVQNLSQEINNTIQDKEKLRLQITNISFSSLDILDTELSKKIQSIQVLNNNATIDSNTFSSLSSCKYIELYENSINKTLKGFNNTGLVRLRVENSEVEFIDNICSYDNHILAFLSFPGNKINKIVKNFSNCIALRFLDLSNNHIDNIEVDAFEGLNKLKTLFLNQNRLTKIYLNTFSNIKRLDMQGNLINTIDSLVSDRLINISQLHLDHNTLNIITKNTFNTLTNLQYIDLTNAKIVSIEPGAFNAFHELHYLYIFSNPITDLPSRSFVGLSKITSINLSKTNLTILKQNQFLGLKSIKYITIDNSKIQTIENESLNLVAELKHFDVSYNYIDIIPCDISNVSLQKMTYLDLSNNRIESIQSCTFNNLPSLMEIYLNDNLINNLVKNTFSHLNSLKVLNIENNRLKCLDDDFISQLPKAVELIPTPFDCKQNNESLQQFNESIISNATISNGNSKENMIPYIWFIVIVAILLVALVVIILAFISLFWYRRKYLLILHAHENSDQEMDEPVFVYNNTSSID